jgi:hypothetical protein
MLTVKGIFIDNSSHAPEGLAAITIQLSAQTGTLEDVTITATITENEHQYSNTWVATNGATTVLYLNESPSENVKITASARGYTIATQVVSATTQTVSIVLEQVSFKALVFTTDNKVWKTTDGTDFSFVGTLPIAPSYRPNLNRFFNGIAVAASTDGNYAYSEDEGATWTTVSVSGFKELRNIRELNGSYYFIGVFTRKMGSDYYQGYHLHNDIKTNSYTSQNVQVQNAPTTQDGYLTDYETNGSGYIGLTDTKVGINGTASSNGGTNLLYGNGMWVVRGSSVLRYGTNGLPNTNATLPVSISNNIMNGNLVFEDGVFVCSSGYGKVLKSANGIDWTLVGSALDSSTVYTGVGMGKILRIRQSGSTIYSSLSNNMESFEAEVATNIQGTPCGVIVLKDVQNS